MAFNFPGGTLLKLAPNATTNVSVQVELGEKSIVILGFAARMKCSTEPKASRDRHSRVEAERSVGI